MGFSRAAIIRYTLLPQFLPRIFAFFKSGFANSAYLIALIFESARLLPHNHPYLNPANIGKYGIRHILTQGGQNLSWTKKNIDQIVVYFTTLIGIALLIGQFILFALALAAEQPAFAQIDTVEDILSVESQYNPGPEQDLAFITMDRVFGVENIFDSCISRGGGCENLRGQPASGEGTNQTYPFPTHLALHKMLEFYSYGIFVISVFIILYMVARIVGETATTGVPFGERINKTWVPIRLILFLALLIPLSMNDQNPGLNGAQIITLWSAKLGSNFATNGWGKFIEQSEDELLGKPEELIATPKAPELGSLVKFIFVAKTCRIAEEMAYEHDVEPYLIRERQAQPLSPGEDSQLQTTQTYDQALRFANYGTLAIRFGSKWDGTAQTEDDYRDYKGYVDPLCGEIKLPTTGGGLTPSGSQAVQRIYYNMINDMWRDGEITRRAECIVRRKFQPANTQECNELPDRAFATETIQRYELQLQNQLPQVIEQQIASGEWNISDNIKSKGWAGAAIWYNQVADLNGEVTTAIRTLPQPSQYPKVLESIALQHAINSKNVNPANAFDPLLANGEEVTYQRFRDKDIAKPMQVAYEFWNDDTLYKSEAQKPTGNYLIEGINALFGTSGIFDIRENTDIHPLAQLSAVGRGMLEASIRNFGIGIIGEGVGFLSDGATAEVSKTIGGFFNTIAFTTVAISFILFYVLPFLPFVYFLFAVGGWVKAIFEAIVAMPLWALAHISRIDGEGIPGPAASNGYFLILEIFLRPILILFGLLASIVIFGSLVELLNEVFNIVVLNVSGFDLENANQPNQQNNQDENLIDFLRSPIDQLFFSVLYTIIVYIVGLSSFKLIDLIPNQITRFMGSSVATLQESDKDPAGGLIQKTYQGANIATGNLKGGALAALVG